MKVRLVSPSTTHTHDSGEEDLGCLRSLEQSFVRCGNGHTLVSRDEEADIILFADPGPLPLGISLLRHPSFRRWPGRSFVYCELDSPPDWFRGPVVSIPRQRFDKTLHRGAAYVREDVAAWTRHLEFPASPKHLFSFCGSVETHPIRSRLHDQFGDCGCLFVTPRSIVQTAAVTGDDAKTHELRMLMEETCRNSLFVLCPRGQGTSSLRLFEVMSMGRAPVIVSDQWVPPFGADWQQFSIQVPESEIHRIPEICEMRRHEARSMGAAAREVWERHYSPARHFNTLVKACEDLLREPGRSGFSRNRLVRSLVSPTGVREMARKVRQQWVG